MKAKLKYVVVGLLAPCLLALAYSYYIEPQRLVINSQTLYIKNWNSAFDGFRIAMISDIHGGSNGGDGEKLRRIVSETNQLQPDLIVLLGDYVSQSGDPEKQGNSIKMPMHEIAQDLAGLQAPYGVLAVLGNHDGWYGDASVRQELEGIGYKVLENQVVTLGRNGVRLRILGLPDHLKINNWKWFSANSRGLLENAGNSGDVIVLEHSPDILPIITGDLLISKDLRLILASHTHGGQVWLPLFGSPIVPSSYGQKYAHGHVVDAGVDMFVTSGTGTSILPFRFLVPPEIALITIKSS